MAGNFLFSGHLIEAPGISIWDAADRISPDTARGQGFGWLDDLAAVADNRARVTAQAWLADWIDRYGRGEGAGWSPDVTGRRLIRWIAHGFFLLRGAKPHLSAAYFQSAAHQTIFLSRRWKAARPGLPRFEALAGMIYAGLSLQGMESRVAPALAALIKDCKTQIGPDGSIPSRNPEELLDVLTLLSWVDTALRAVDEPVPEEITAAMLRIAPTLRALRHPDGGLARFHGGGRGLEGALDHVLSTVGRIEQPQGSVHMGFARLTAGRSSVIMDVGVPPRGVAAFDAHASTLAFELTSGRRPVIVNCGSGVEFGPEWRRAGRATPSHSALTLGGVSSSRITPAADGRERLEHGPGEIQLEFTKNRDMQRVAAGHDGYRDSHGLIHARTLNLSADGRSLAGEDLLTGLSEEDVIRFDKAMDSESLQGIPWGIRFHLHPEVEPALDLGGRAVSLTLKSGEIWVLRPEGEVQLSVEASVYLENGRLRPRATQQVVLSGRTMSYATRIRWSLAKAQETPTVMRDVSETDVEYDI